jgi:putative ABC transport system permease protein
MKQLGFTAPGKIIGQKIHLWSDEPEIIGVIKDYHQQSLKVKVKPLILVYDKGISDFISIKIKTSKPIGEIITQAGTRYRQAFPGHPFSYYFVDDHYAEQYKSEQLFASAFGWFTLAAILIACLGLFGLSSLLVVQRTKEIGIRKVLGATAQQIGRLMSKDFVIIVIVANVIAWPIAYGLMREWLSDFAYRIELNVLLFIIPGLSALVIAVITVSAQAIKAALINPVENLRSD